MFMLFRAEWKCFYALANMCFHSNVYSRINQTIMKCSSVVKAKRSPKKKTGENALSNTAPQCSFHISASMFQGPPGGVGHWRFGTVRKIHTCWVDEAGRSRNINSKIVVATSEALLNFVPGNRKSHGNTKQVQQIAKKAGLELKPSQDFYIVKDQSQHTIEFHLVSYWFMARCKFS